MAHSKSAVTIHWAVPFTTLCNEYRPVTYAGTSNVFTSNLLLSGTLQQTHSAPNLSLLVPIRHTSAQAPTHDIPYSPRHPSATMQLTITTTQDEVALIDVTADMSIEDLARKIQEKLSIPPTQQQLYYKNEPLPLSGTVRARGIEDGDIIIVNRLSAQAAPVPAPAPGGDMMSLEAQKAIEERIRQENVMENMELAFEHNPESFGSVIMLFVDCKVNGVSGVKAFVDSGAQATIISKECAERCNILRLMDSRFAGIARGVGTAKIHGRIHLTLLTLGTELFEVTFTVMDAVGGGYDMLLGLDMLRKHQAAIDLANNCLRMGTAQVPFLQEKDIPRRMRESPEEATQRAISESAAAAPGATAAASAAAPRAAAPAAAAAPVAPGGGRRLGGASAGPVNESAVSKLIELGFSRDEATQALREAGGNTDQAAALLTHMKYGF